MEDPRTHLCLTVATDESVYLFRRKDPDNYVEIFNAGRPDGRPATLRIGITAPIAIRISRRAEDVMRDTEVVVEQDSVGNLCLTLGSYQAVYLWEAGTEEDEESVEVMVIDDKTHRIVVSAPQSWRIFRHPCSEHAEVAEEAGTAKRVSRRDLVV